MFQHDKGKDTETRLCKPCRIVLKIAAHINHSLGLLCSGSDVYMNDFPGSRSHFTKNVNRNSANCCVH